MSVKSKFLIKLFAALSVCTLFSQPVMAQSETGDDEWNHSLAVYLWGANIGAGDSDLTWQAMAGVAFKASSWADIALTYRHLEWDLGADLVDDLRFSGPMLGVIFRF